MKVPYQLLFACALPLSLYGQEDIRVSGAKVTEVGLYKAQVITADTNVAGVKLEGLDEFKLLKSTTNVPARIGTRFGFRYEILGTPSNAPITLTMVGKHPPIKNPRTGKTETKDTYQLNSWIGKTYTSNSLDEDSDLVPGPWTFEVWYEGKKVCEQSFVVVADEKEKKSSKPPAQPQSMGLHISPPPPGAEPYVFTLILTNAQPPPMRSLIAISKSKKYEWHKIAADGTASTARGVVPTDIYDAVIAEWRAMSGRTSVDPTREQAAYVASVDAVHPPQVQRLLDYLSK